MSCISGTVSISSDPYFLKVVMGVMLTCAAVAQPGTFSNPVPDVPAGVDWPELTPEMKPWVYNWWMGCAVTAEGLEDQAAAFAAAGFGGFHVIPIYGVIGNEANDVAMMSSEGLARLDLAAAAAKRHGLGMDVSGAAGFTFGSKALSKEEGLWVFKDWTWTTRGGDPEPVAEGRPLKVSSEKDRAYTLDPFSPESMRKTLAGWERFPGRAMYHDSYDYHFAAWTPRFEEEFRRRRGYDIRDRWEAFCGRGDSNAVTAVKYDYRKTLAELQEETFRTWTDWCRARGVLTRYEAHGSPANWLDLYALADIPESEVCGWYANKEPITKFASSAAHVTGKRLVGCETGTWLANHYQFTLGRLKRMCDDLFVSGVNHVFYHGCCYSPKEAPWPGWSFYATMQMNPRNPVWRDLGALNAYVARCQSLLQTWECDNDVLVRWSVEDWLRNPDGYEAEAEMNVGNVKKWFEPSPVGQLARRLWKDGYSFDYASDRQVEAMRRKGFGRYALVIEPGRPLDLKKARKETLPGLSYIRLRKGEDILYFIANVGNAPVKGTFALTALASRGAAYAMDAWTGDVRAMPVEGGKVALDLPVGASTFVCCTKEAHGTTARAAVGEPSGAAIVLDGAWRRKGVAGGPELPPEETVELGDWAKAHPAFAGTMVYAREFDLPEFDAARAYRLDLGKVCESARVRVNGRELGVRVLAPYAFEVPAGLLRAEGNRLEVEVTNLGQNRIRDLDRRGVNWKYFKERNVFAPNYKPLDASGWPLAPSGLFGPVKVTAVRAAAVSPLQAKIDACARAGGGRVLVPAGEHVTGKLHLRSNVELHLDAGARLVFTDDPADYLPPVRTALGGIECLGLSPLIYACGCTNVALTGEGTLAPRTARWERWAVWPRPPKHMAAFARLYAWGDADTPVDERDVTKLDEGNMRPILVQFNRCRNVRIEGVRIRESPMWCIHLFQCEDAVVRGVDIKARGHNNDGVDVESSRNVLIENCRVDQGDDAIVIKSGRDRDGRRRATPVENVEARNCHVVKGLTLLGIGSEVSGGVRNVRVHDCTGDACDRLFQIKTSRRKGAFVEDVRFERIRCAKSRIGLAIETDVEYQYRDFPARETNCLTRIADVVLSDVTIGETKELIRFLGDKDLPVRNVKLANIVADKVTGRRERIENVEVIGGCGATPLPVR